MPTNGGNTLSKICFVVELPLGFWQWDDGLRGAMQLLEEKHKVCYHLSGKPNEDCKPDILFVWGGTLSGPYKASKNFNSKKILFFAGGPIEPEFFEKYDMVLFENQIHTDIARAKGIKCMTAFGTNTKVFKPMKNAKLFDAFYPGAFGLWKRKDLFAEAVKGLRAFSCGNIQKQEPECYDVCVDNGVGVSADIPQGRLPYFMSMSRTIVVLPVPEIGCQRTVLEAQAMNLPIIVPNDAPLVVEFAKHGGIIVDPDPASIRYAIQTAPETNEDGLQYVLNNMTEQHYANKIMSALEAI